MDRLINFEKTDGLCHHKLMAYIYGLNINNDSILDLKIKISEFNTHIYYKIIKYISILNQIDINNNSIDNINYIIDLEKSIDSFIINSLNIKRNLEKELNRIIMI